MVSSYLRKSDDDASVRRKVCLVSDFDHTIVIKAF